MDSQLIDNAINELETSGQPLAPSNEPQVTPEGDPFEAAIAYLSQRGELEDAPETSKKALQAESLGGALSVGPSPDQAARDQRLTRKLDLNDDTLEALNPVYAETIRALGDTPDNFVRAYPRSAKALGNPQTRAIARDDIDSLKTLEAVLAKVKGADEAEETDAYGNVYGEDLDDNAGISYAPGLREFKEGLDRRLGATMTGVAAGVPALAEGIDGLLLLAVDFLTDGLNLNGDTLRAARERIDAWRKTNRDIKTGMVKEAQDAFDSQLAKMAASGFASGGQNLLTLGAAALMATAGAPITVPALALGIMGFAAAGSAYGEGKDERLNTGMALLNAVAQGGLEAATEKLPLASLVKLTKVGGVSKFLAPLKNYILGEQVGEQINTFLGDLVNFAMIDRNKGKSLGDFFAERGDKAVETAMATLAGSGVQAGGAIGLNIAARTIASATEAAGGEVSDLRQRADAGERSRELYRAITELATASKIAMRSPEAMPGIVSAMIGDKVPYAYLPAEVLNQEGIADMLLQSAPALDGAVREAQATGADIRIPMESMVAITQNADLNAAISRDVRFSPDELSARQAQERIAGIGEDVEKRLEQEMRAANPKRQNEVETIAQNISSQLIAAGMRPEEARANGAIHAAFFNTMAAMKGVNPLELAQKYGLQVQKAEAAPQPQAQPVASPAAPIRAVKPAASAGEAVQTGADLQNRDRGKGSSILQMRSIAANLQYGLVGPGHNLGNDAPIVSYGTIPENQFGAEDFVITAKGTAKVPVRYAVVEADEVQTSNSAETGAWNERYGDRSLVNAIVGNGRLAAMTYSYQNGMADQYRKEFAADAAHGISTEVIAGMKHPVLVRVIDPQYVTKDLIDESNSSSIQRMSPAEQAKNDARALDLESLRFDANGLPTAESVRNFVSWLDPNEAAGLIGADNQVTRQAYDRISAAIFAKAYADDRLISMYAEAEDPTAKLVINALSRLSPQAARLEGKGELDIRPALVDAVNSIIQGRKKLYKFADIAKQTDMFADPDIALFIEVFGLNPRSMREAVDILWNAMEKAADSVDNLDTASGALFDDVPVDTAMSRKELIDLIRSDLEEAKARRESGEFNQEARADIPPIAEAPDFELITVAKDKDGTEHRVLGVNGNPDLAMMPDGVEGIKPLPVRLQEETVKRDHLKGHLNELKKVGYESVEQAVWDISKNYDAIYEGSQEGGLVLARALPDDSASKSVLLVKLQDIAGCYRVGSVFLSGNRRYLKNRALLWGMSPPIRLQQENPPRTQGLTGPKDAPDGSILSNIEKEINTLKTGGSSDELFQAEGGDQIEPIADRLRQTKEQSDTIKPSGGKRYANPDAEEHARFAERLRNQEPRDFRQEYGRQKGQHRAAALGRATKRVVQRLDGNALQTRGGARVLARWEAPAEQKERIKAWLDEKTLKEAQGKTFDQLKSLYGSELEDIATIPVPYVKAIFGDQVSDNRVYTSKAYFLDHVFNHHLNDIDKDSYLAIQEIIEQPDEVIRDNRINEKGERRDGAIFVKRYEQNYLLAINLVLDSSKNKLQIYKSLSKTKRKPYPKLDRVTLPADANPAEAEHLRDSGVPPKEAPGGGRLSTLGKDIVHNAPDKSNDRSKQSKDYWQKQNSGPRGAYSPSQRLITLFQSSDASTFIHESGHFFLDVMTDLANEPDAPQRLRQDMRVLMSWFGIKSLDDWNAMTLDEKREYHEKFARGFERYMREGKAPSIKLMRIFHSFMRWLKTVYSAVKSINVDLTDDVREVMDRMLASDAEIRNAKAVMKLAGAFTTRESFPGTDEEWHEWQRRIQDEDEFAAARLTAQLVDERMFLEKKTQEYAEKFADEDRAWAEAYKEAYAEAIDKIRKDPLFKMRKAFFGDGQGDLPYPLLRSDTEGLEGEQIEALDKLGVLSDTGYPIETVARQFGYDNELDFIRDVILMGPVTEEIAARQAAEAAVKKEFGTRMNAEKIRKLAREAAMNDLVVERLNKELSLMKAIKKDPVVLQAAKAWAESTVSAMQVKDLTTASFRSAMEKYGRAYERALARGDAQTAYEAKRAQLFNAAALRAVDESLRRVEHLVKEVKRMGVRYRRVLRKEQDAGYLDQILNLAGKYGIRDEHKPRESFTKFAESMEELGRPMGLIDPDIFSDANAKPYTELTMDEFTNLETAVSVLAFQGGKARAQALALARKTAEDTAKMAVSEMVPGKKVERGDRTAPDNPWIVGLDSFFLSHRKFSSLMREMGGLKDNTAMMRMVHRLNHCGDREVYMQTLAGQKLIELLSGIKSTRLNAKIKLSIANKRITRSEALAVALNYGNETNRQRLSNSYNEAQVQEILSHLTSEELAFVQNVWDYLESYWPEMDALEKRTNGISPRKVEATPFTVKSVDGKEVAMKGGYYPIVYDPDKNAVSAEQQMKELGANMLRGAVQSSATKQSHMKSRQEEIDRKLLLDMSVIGRHLNQVIHDLCFREWVQSTNRVFRNRNFKNAVQENFGVGFYRALSDHLVAIASGGNAMVNPALESLLGRVGNFLKGNVSFNAMALSLTTAALQPLGITQSIQRVGAKWVFAAGLKMTANPVAAFKEAREKSLMMRERSRVLNADIADFNALTRAGKLGKVGRTYEKLAFAPMQLMQAFVDIPTWHAAYMKALAEGAPETRAVDIADQAVLDSQGGGQNKDRSNIHRNHPFLTMFYSFFSATENLWAESASQQNYRKLSGVAGFARDMTLLMLVPSLGQAVLFAALRGDDMDKDPEEWLKWVLSNLGGFATGMIVGLRELSGVFSGYGYSGPPLSRILTDLGNAASRLLSDKAEDEDKVLAALAVLADMVKIPFTQIRRSFKGWRAYIEGESDTPTSILFGKPQK